MCCNPYFRFRSYNYFYSNCYLISSLSPVKSFRFFHDLAIICAPHRTERRHRQEVDCRDTVILLVRRVGDQCNIHSLNRGNDVTKLAGSTHFKSSRLYIVVSPNIVNQHHSIHLTCPVSQRVLSVRYIGYYLANNMVSLIMKIVALN